MNKNGDHINDKTDIEFEAELIIRKLSDIVDIIQYPPLGPMSLS
ncbi:hypothetical protein [Clostridium neonatale]|nr:hypothetical protein CNEO3_160002 [Clostridium neonatale]CAI3551235.1 hypothetical protein CNEO3_100002 [Clostridium neonatale]CAI3566396.1 hypothetical protein CNEO3_190002 [Clostridium neonatale]CAI3639796.1 hypothetical protein CNEO3_20002 [Clostridium neonatale]CAI3647313.1 hypothetical protein CNEO3_30002 [Clostridium neonatale]